MHYRDIPIDQIHDALGPAFPRGLAAVVRNYYERDPLSFNTDWAGTMPMWGLAMWARRGLPGALDYVQAWFESHLLRDPQLSDDEFYKTYCSWTADFANLDTYFATTISADLKPDPSGPAF